MLLHVRGGTTALHCAATAATTIGRRAVFAFGGNAGQRICVSRPRGRDLRDTDAEVRSPGKLGFRLRPAGGNSAPFSCSSSAICNSLPITDVGELIDSGVFAVIRAATITARRARIRSGHCARARSFVGALVGSATFSFFWTTASTCAWARARSGLLIVLGRPEYETILDELRDLLRRDVRATFVPRSFVPGGEDEVIVVHPPLDLRERRLGRDPSELRRGDLLRKATRAARGIRRV